MITFTIQKQNRRLKVNKDYKPFIDNYGEYDEDVSGDLVLVDAKKLDKLILSIGGCEEDYLIGHMNDLPEGKYYILRAINIETKEVK